jgi:hypothetical protein
MERLAKLRLYGVTALLVTAIVVLLPVASSAGSVDSKVDVKIWGRAKFDMQWDTGQMATELASYLVDDSTHVLNFNPRDTRFGISGGIAEGDWKAKAVLEIDFWGASAGDNLLPRLRLGYANMAHKSGFSMRGGQDWIPILQQNPATIEFGILSWGGNLWWRVPQLTFRYDTQGDTKLQFLLSFMKHRLRYDSAVPYRPEEKMPWILGRIAWKDFLKDGGELAISGGFRTVSFDIGDNKTQDFSPYIGGFEFNLPFAEKKVILKGEAYVSGGAADEYLHYGFNYNPIHPDEDDPTKGKVISSTGGFASLTWNINPTWVIDVGAGTDNPKDEDLKVSDDYVLPVRYARNTVIFGNLKMKMNKHCGIGFEVMSFDTEHFEQVDIPPDTYGDLNKTYNLTGQRFTLSTWFVF